MQEILVTSIYGIRRDIDARKCCILSHRILGQSFASIQTEHPRVHSWFKASANRDKMIRILSVTWRLGRSSEDEPICVGLWVSCAIGKHNVDSKICLPRGSQSLKEPVWKCLTVPDRIRIRKCWLLRPGKKNSILERKREPNPTPPPWSGETNLRMPSKNSKRRFLLYLVRV